MALKLKKKTIADEKPTAASKAKETTVDDFKNLPEEAQIELIEAAIDKRGMLMEEEAKLKTRMSEISKQKKYMEEILQMAPGVDELEPSETLDLETDHFLAVVGKLGTARSITDEGKEELLSILGIEDFMKLAGFKITDMDKYLTGAQKDMVMTTEFTTRSVTVKPRK